MSKIAIIGAGNLGKSIAKGFALSKKLYPEDITVCRRNLDKLDFFRTAGFNVTSSISEAVAGAEVVIICVQPSQIKDISKELQNSLAKERSLIISTLTGVSINELKNEIGLEELNIIRAMPNTAIAIRESMTCVCSAGGDKKGMDECKRLFGYLGEVIEIEEKLMKAATVLAASNIAFVMRMIRAIIQGGIQLGFHSEDAQEIAIQVTQGAAKLLKENQSHPEMEIDKVTTPQGCTIEGLNEMEHQGLSSAIIKGLVASYEKIAKIRE